MALSGSFNKYPTSQFGLYCTWSGVQSRGGNYTDVTLNVYLRFYSLEVGSRADSTISINGVSETYTAASQYDYSTNAWHNVLLKSKTVRVVHNADGTKKSVNLKATWRFSGNYSGVSIGTITAEANVDLDTITTYTLSTSAGTGSSITVNRTSSGYASTGNISNGARLYYGDKLKISASPSANYQISTLKVNNSNFTSGNTHTVKGNVSVASTAQVLASSVGATNANIGAVSTITVTKYNTAYYHTLQYSFGSLSGYITSSGGVSSTASKFSATSIAFIIPTSFYAQIPNAKTGTCTITCKTYSNSSSTTQLGNATTCQITVTATGSPTVSGTVIDTNATTVALTGDSNKLIRYKSTAKATITATAKNSSSISAKYINGVAPTNNVRTFTGVSITSFVFKATDSRGYSASKAVTPTMVAYVALTCNPIIYRPTPTGSSIMMSFSGNVYRGSFGACSNTLTLQYRYKVSGGSYGSWQTVDSTNIVFGTSTYRSSADISIGDDFDYHADYVFQVRVTDGGTVNGTNYTLSSVTKIVNVKRGIPVFDWGENDFNVNVALMLNNVNILNIMYPVGAVYMHSSSTIPTVVSQVGTWQSVTTGITGVYAWKRTA